MPQLEEVWQKAFAPIAALHPRPIVQCLIWLGLCWAVPMAVALIPATLVVLFYHPLPHKGSSDPVLTARRLQKGVADIQANKAAEKPKITMFANIMYGVIWAACFLGYIVYSMRFGKNYDAVVTRAPFYIFGIAVVLMVAYRLLNLPVKYGLRLISYTYVPEQLPHMVNHYLERMQKEAEEKKDAQIG